MAPAATVNYRETHFPHAKLTKNIGQPTYSSLHALFVQLKANAMSVHSNLGGGRHGHLGLLLTTQAYSILLPIPYVRPPYPPTPVYPPYITHQHITNITNAHKEALRKFHKVIGVERALIKQIIETIDEAFLKAVKNRITGQFTGSVFDMTAYLRNTYGRISAAQLLHHDSEIITMAYDPESPIEIVFKAIKDLLEYGDEPIYARTSHR